MNLLRSKSKYSKLKKLLLTLGLSIICVAVAFAGWETYVQLTDPDGADLIAVQDVSNQSLNASGRVSYLLLEDLADFVLTYQTAADQAEMEAGTETAIRSMSPLRVAQAIAAQVDTSARTVTVHGSVSSGTETFSPGVHTITVAGAFTWAFDDWPASGTKGVVEVDITNGGAATITGWSSILWEGGTEPTLQTSGLDTLIFRSLDGGTTIYGYVAGEDMK